MRQNLDDITFLIIVRLDTIERIENILAVTSFILSQFNTNINIWESSYRYNGYLKKLLPTPINYKFIQDDDPILYRTRYINRMVEDVRTPFVSVWDTDVIATCEQILDSVKILRKGEADFVYPYETFFLDTSLILRNIFFKRNNDISFLMENRKRMQIMYPPNPVGGAYFCNVYSYKKSGLENEDFYGWGVEDGERYVRWERKGFTTKRVEGTLFHLTHPRGINSLIHHPDQSLIKTKLMNLSNNIK
jgi:hypothetical protein